MKKILLALLSIVLVAITSLISYLNVAYPNVSLENDIQIELTEDRISHGKYLVENVALCIDCHSERDYTRYSAPIKEGTEGVGGEAFSEKKGFPGNFYAKNITPVHLGDWSDAELYRAIAEGVNKKGEALFPIMPYLSYGQLEKEDIFSMIAYIRQLDENGTKGDVPESNASFPFSMILKTIPTKAEHQLRKDTTDMVSYGKYMVTMASCAECHTQKEAGENVPGMEFAGGFLMPLANGKYIKTANITPDDETGIGNWTEEKFIKTFKSYSDSNYADVNVADDEFNTTMPWTSYSGMKENDLKAIYAYLKSIPAISNRVEKIFYEK